MNETTKGMLALVGATVTWGLSAMYYKLIAHVPPLEVLSHRTLWSLVFFGAFLALRGRLGEVRALLGAGRSFALVLFAAVMISTNWFFFIYSVQIGHAVEASLGYYIFPLVAVVLGMLIYGERLSRLKVLAVGLAGIAVVVLTIGLGVAPWVSLVLAVTFGMYGMVKKGLDAGPVVSVTAEVVLLAPLAAVWLFGVHALGWTGLVGRAGGAFGGALSDSLLLAFSGVMTAVPLLLFTTASRLLPMGTVGVMQYINPTLQFLVATLVFAEPVTHWHAIAFPLIWVAVALYSIETIRQDRARNRALRTARRAALS